MADFKYFRHTLTGKVGLYPENFGDLFSETFIEVDSDAANCVDCWLKPDDEVLDEDFAVAFPVYPDEDDDEFPAPVLARSDEKKKDK